MSNLRQSRSIGNLPEGEDSQTAGRESALLTPRAAGILGASLIVAVTGGVLAWMALGRAASAWPGAVIVGVTAFAGAVTFFRGIIQ